MAGHFVAHALEGGNQEGIQEVFLEQQLATLTFGILADDFHGSFRWGFKRWFPSNERRWTGNLSTHLKSGTFLGSAIAPEAEEPNLKL